MPDEISMPLAVACSLLMVVGSIFAVLAAIGFLRLPDVYTRMHAVSKAGTIGSCLLLVAVGLHAGDPAVSTRAFAGVVFFLLTAPVAAHLLARAAHRAGCEPAAVTVIDELSAAHAGRAKGDAVSRKK